jgi:hypothetical protein
MGFRILKLVGAKISFDLHLVGARNGIVRHFYFLVSNSSLFKIFPVSLMTKPRDVVSFITVPYNPTTRVVKTDFSSNDISKYSENKFSDNLFDIFSEQQLPGDEMVTLGVSEHQLQLPQEHQPFDYSSDSMDQSFSPPEDMIPEHPMMPEHHMMPEHPILPLVVSSSSNEISFWTNIAHLISKIAGVGPDRYNTFHQAVLDHCQTLHLRQEPSEIQILRWIFGDFSTHPNENVSLSNDPAFQLTFRVFEDDMLDDDTLANHLQWHQMTNFQRYYYLYCTTKRIEEEKSQDDPYLDPWSFQYLVLCMLFGSDYIFEKAHTLLKSLNLNIWCSEYLYSGGLVRQGMLTAMSYSATNYDHRRLLSVLDVVLGTIQDQQDASKIGYWVAFFEQRENLEQFQRGLYTYVQENKENQRFNNLQETLNQIPLVEFTTRKMKQGVFKCVRSVQNGMVELEYHGCPKTVFVHQSKIPVGKISECLKNFVSDKIM